MYNDEKIYLQAFTDKGHIPIKDATGEVSWHEYDGDNHSGPVCAKCDFTQCRWCDPEGKDIPECEDEIKSRILGWVNDIRLDFLEDDIDKVALDSALYCFSERNLWKSGDLEIKDPELAIQIWRVVENIRRKGNFPRKFRV